MAKNKQDEQYFDLYFPMRGYQDGQSLNFMQPGFTPLGTNVRVHEALTGRGRGGSRAGIDKFIPEQHSGDYAIQHLNTIVTVDGALLGWSFNGIDQGFPGVYGGIGFLSHIHFSPVESMGAGDGGGGYQPNSRVVRRNLVMSVENEEWPAGVATTPVYVTVTDEDGDYVPSEFQILLTSPEGAPLDQTQESTQISLDDPPAGVNGVAQFDVYSITPRTIYYSAKTQAIAGHPFFARRPKKIRFTPYKLTHVVDDATVNVSDTVTVTFTLLNPDATPAVGKTIILHATGGTGEGLTAVTNASGVAAFANITSDIAQTVVYTGTELSESVHSISQNVTVTYLSSSQYRQSNIAFEELALAQSTMQVSTSIDILAGSLLVVSAGLWSIGKHGGVVQSPVIALTDNLGHVYSVAATVDQSDTTVVIDGVPAINRGTLYYVANTTAGACTVTATISGTRTYPGLWVTLAVHEYTGIATASPLHDTASASGESVSPATGAVTINSVGDLICACYVHGDVDLTFATLTAADFTEREVNILGNTYEGMGTADYEEAASGAGGTWTLSNSCFWVAIAASFKQV